MLNVLDQHGSQCLWFLKMHSYIRFSNFKMVSGTKRGIRSYAVLVYNLIVLALKA